MILTILAEEKKIKKYEYIGKFTYKFIKQEELAIKLYFNKHRQMVNTNIGKWLICYQVVVKITPKSIENKRKQMTNIII